MQQVGSKGAGGWADKRTGVDKKQGKDKGRGLINRQDTMKVVFCWTDISGYMAACWRAMVNLPDIDVFVIAFQSGNETAFSDKLMQGIPCRLLNSQERQDTKLIQQLVLAACADVVVVSGWLHKPYRQLAFTSELRKTAFVMAMDTPWQGTWKQHLAPWFLRFYLQRMSCVVVAGERSWQYAQHLGVPPANIVRGLYGIDGDTWMPLWQQRLQQGWGHSFLFVGRYVPTKAIDVLVAAYQHYRLQVQQPWNLVCCGQGVLVTLVEGQPGIENLGFLQPTEMDKIFLSAGAFVLPSRFDPWPLALLEAAASGLPIICTDACGSAVEVLRPHYNGLIVPPENALALAKALVTIHECHTDLPTWGMRSQQLAAPYTANIWATRWRQLLRGSKGSGGSKQRGLMTNDFY